MNKLLFKIASCLIVLGLGVFSQAQAQTYCTTPTVVNQASYGCGIARFTMGTINNTSGNTNGTILYQDFTNLSASGQAGSTQNYSILASTGNASRISMYVDWNQDGNFGSGNPEEVLVAATVNSNATYSGSFTIPAGTNPGVYRLRLVGDISFITPQPCRLEYTGDIEDYTLIVTTNATEVATINTTNALSIGSNTIPITWANLGNTNITSLNIGYQLNNNTPVTQTLSSLSVAPGSVINQNFTTSLNIASAGVYTLKVWVSQPNGNLLANANDTITRTIRACFPLSGNYTVNPNGSGATNFTSISAALNDLAQCGISGPVSFDVSAATFTEQVTLLPVAGASTTNTITFTGQGVASTILTFANQNATNPHTMAIRGGRHYTFRNMTIRSTSSSNGYVVWGTGPEVRNFSLVNCKVEVAGGGATSTSTAFGGVIMSSSATSVTGTLQLSDIRIDSCEIVSGYANISFAGVTSVSTNVNVIVNASTLSAGYLYGIYANGVQEMKFTNNVVGIRATGNSATNSFGIYAVNCNSSYPRSHSISGNKITDAGQYGIYFSSTSGSVGGKGLMANNMVGGGFRNTGSTYGIFMSSSNWWNVFFNSVNVDNNPTTEAIALYINNSTNSFTVDVRNNMLQCNSTSTNAWPLWVNSPTVLADLDYNNYWRSGTSQNIIYLGQAYVRSNFKGAQLLNNSSSAIEAPYASSTNLRHTNGCLTGIYVSQVPKDIDNQTRSTLPVIGADEFLNNAINDIAVSSIISPTSNASVGTYNVVVVLKNYGSNTINSASVSYTVNGGAAKTVNWSGTLIPCGEVQITFSGANAVNIGGGLNLIRAYSSSPNGIQDANPGNDAVESRVCPPLSGTFTINPSGTNANNFVSFTQAAEALSCAGLNGPVLIQVAAGTYNEQAIFTGIPGLSSTNTLTIDGGEGNAASRVVVFGNSQTNSRHTIMFDNLSNVSVRNITFRNNSASFGYPLMIFGTNITNFEVVKCRVELVGAGAGSTSTNFSGIVFTNSLTSPTSNATYSNIRVDSNFVSGGYYAIVMNGNGNTTTNVVFRNNTVVNYYYYALYLNNMNAVSVLNNNFTSRPGNASSTGIYAINMNANTTPGNRFNNNRIVGQGQYGMFFSSASNNGGRGEIINNMIGGGYTSTNPYGIYLASSNYWNIYHNNINIDNIPTSGASSCLYTTSSNFLDIRNNHFVFSNTAFNNGSIYPMNISTNSTSLICDYNNYFKSGNTTNLIIVNASAYNLSNYKGGGGFNTNSYSLDPQFTSNLDLHTSNGCMIGTPVGVTLDFDGQSRNSSPSLGADEGVNTDLVVTRIIAPSGTNVTGNQDITFEVRNNGRNTITSFTAGYSVNGGASVTQAWTGTLNPCAATTVTFTGAQAANFTGLGLVSLATFGVNPNGAADNNTLNDTLAAAYCNGPLTGTITINPRSSAANNLPSLSVLSNVLFACGINGNVTINVAPGTYNNQLLLNTTIPGLATGSITIDGGDSSQTKITSGAAYTVRLDGIDNVTIRNLWIENTASANCWAMHLTNGADNNIIEKCRITSAAVNNGSVVAFGITGTAPTSSGANWGNNNMLRNTWISGGYYGVIAYGSGNTSTISFGNKFRNNRMDNALGYPFYAYFQQDMQVWDNTIEGTSNSIYTVYTSYCPQMTVDRNYMYGSSNFVLYTNQANPNTGFSRARISNNIIGGLNSTGNYVVYMINTFALDFLHNSIHVSAQNTNTAGLFFSSGNGNNFINNIISAEGQNSLTVYLNTTNPFTRFDYNQLYSAGTNFAYIWGTNVFDLAGLRSIYSGTNANSVASKPQFVNATGLTPDLHLNQNFAAPYGDNTLGINVDIDGEARCPVAKTIGADESRFVSGVRVQFTAPDTVFVNSPFSVINAALPGDLNLYEWDFGNDGSVEFTTLNATYTFNSAGLKQIKLKSSSCTTSDSLVRNIVVIAPVSVPVADFITNKYIVAPFEELTLLDLSTNGPIGWEWEITPFDIFTTFDPNDQNPQVFFGTPGKYDVCLTSENFLGKSAKKCKTAYVTVKAVNQMCIGDNQSTAATGEIYDSGGPDFNYSDREFCDFTIAPCASSITLKFTEFVLANAGDVLRIYDGKDLTGRLLGVYTSSSGLPGGTNGITATTGSMYLTWESGLNGNAAGFKATWTSVADTNSVTVISFDRPDTVFTGNDFMLKSTSTGRGLSYEWDFENDGFPDGFDDEALVNFMIPGVYTPKLTVTDACGNIFTLIDTVHVVDPTVVPTVDFRADIILADLNDTVRFTDLSGNGPTAWRYSFSPANGVVVGGSSRNPFIQFTAVGTYAVTLEADNAVGTGTLTKTAYIRVVDICEPTNNASVPDVGISLVRLNNLENVSSPGSAAFTSYFNVQQIPAAEVDAGGTYTIRVGRTTALNRANRKVWVDYNADGDFNDAGELIASEAAALTTNWDGTFTVPFSAVRGVTRMRVGISFADSTNDPCGNNFYGEVEEYRLLISDDKTAPTITLLDSAQLFVEIGVPYVDPGATAFDAVDGNLTGSIVVSGSVNVNIAGDYTLRYNVSDLSGNAAAEVTRRVTVLPDVTKPILQLNTPLVMTLPLLSTFVEPGFSATDAISGNVTSSVVVNRGGFDSSVVGSYRFVYVAYDASGNTDTLVRVVNIVDVTAPVLTINGASPLIVDVNTAYSDPGVLVSDNYDAVISATTTGTVDITVLGDYTVTYRAQDQAGNIATLNRIVRVVDRVAPQLQVTSADTIIAEVFGTYASPIASASDNYDVSPVINVQNNVNMSVLGVYSITYTAEDQSGNTSSSVTKYVRVVDTKAPVITLNGAYLVTVQRWSTFNDPDVTVTDNYDQQSQLTVVKGGNFVNTSEEGLYFITYDVTDLSGNVAAQVTRAINVVENLTSVDAELQAGWNLYPNPSSIGKVFVSFENASSSETPVEVINGLGQKVLSQSVPASANTFELNMEGLKPGVYHVRVKMDGQWLIKKLVIAG